MKTRTVLVLFLAAGIIFVAWFLLTPSSRTEYVQAGEKLVGSGALGASEQGVHVAISSDGTTAMIGGWRDNGGSGAAWIFRLIGDDWVQDGPKLTAEDAVGVSLFGYSVALSGNGNTALIGGIYDDQSKGAVWVFTRRGGAWARRGMKLIGLRIAGAANFGFSVDLSDDGNTAIIGGFYDSAGVGAAWVFTRSGETWSQQGEKLVGSVIRGIDAYFGTSVALSADGNTAVIGGSVENDGVGAAWIFTRTGTHWAQEGGKLVGTGAVGESHQGNSVAISSGGNVALVGGHFDDNNKGAVWSFRRMDGVWEQIGEKIVGADANGYARQGISIALSGDGMTAVIGGDLDHQNAGATWVFTRTGNAWAQMGRKLVGEPADEARQGAGVALSADAGTLVVGAPSEQAKIGAAWIFTRGRARPFSLR